MPFHFGPFRADRAAYRVSRNDAPLELTPKLLDLLLYFVERPGRLITKEELLDGVWPDANVTDNALAQAVSELREALGDSAASPTYIRTVARRGYRFVAAVEVTDETPAAAEAKGGAGSVEAPRALAVLDFTNVTGEADVAWLSAGIAETVSSDLAGLEHFRVMDRWRVRQASMQSPGSMHDVGAALGVTLVATGSFQRRGPQIRISARIVDLEGGEAVADAKVDGVLDDVFALQDGIVTALAREMGIPRTPRATLGYETSNLEAYRAYTEGSLTIETLDTDHVGPAILDFERAILADPGFAQAFAGLANAEFVAHEMTRQTRDPNHDALRAGIEHAQHAIRLAPDLAEAHATLSFLLSSAGRHDEAQTAGRRAVAIDPENWRHQYRLGHATWGVARLRALDRALRSYPQFSFARLEMAMVHVARGDADVAEALVRQGAVEQDLQHPTGSRFPGAGFHWLLGALHATRDRHDEAIAEFDRELARVDRRRLYGPEYAEVALYWRGYSELALERPADALASFQSIADFIDGHPRGLLGATEACRRLGDETGMSEARQRAREARDHFTATGRVADGLLLAAIDAVQAGDPEAAVRNLEALLDLPVSSAGWTIPLEPALRPLQVNPGFARVLARLEDRAS